MGVFQIAIDGPVAAGKGTVSKKLAEALGFLYVDTGATYRVATLIAMRNNFNFERLMREEKEDVVALAKLVELSTIEMWKPREGEKKNETNSNRKSSHAYREGKYTHFPSR